MLHVTTLRHRASIRTAAGAAVLALLLALGAAAPAAAAAPDDRHGEVAWPGSWQQLGSVIARWLGLGPEQGSGIGGAGMKPSALAAASDGGPEMDPTIEGGPEMDPNGATTDGGPHMDPNG